MPVQQNKKKLEFGGSFVLATENMLNVANSQGCSLNSIMMVTHYSLVWPDFQSLTQRRKHPCIDMVINVEQPKMTFTE